MNKKPSADKDKQDIATVQPQTAGVKRQYFDPESGISVEAESLDAAVSEINKTKQKVSSNDK